MMVRITSLVCALALALPAIAAAAPGDRDPAFSGDGLVREPGLPPAVAVAVDDGGGVVAAGTETGGGAGVNAVISRFRSDGSLDPAFGDAGVARPALAVRFAVVDLALQPDGRIVVAGTVGVGSSGADFGVLRLLGDGAPDPSFGGGDGLATIPVDDGFDSAGALAVQPDGRIVVVGTGGNGSGGLAVAVARLQTGGQPDPSFSGDGLTVVDAGPLLYSADAVAIATDGSIAVGAGGLKSPLSSFGDLTAVKLEADGDPVAGFGDGGVAKLDFGYGEAATGVLFGPAGTITLPGSLCTGGTHGSCGGIVGRLLADGSPDPSFGDAGRVRPTLRARNAAELLADGRTMIGGAEYLGKPTGSDFTLERLTADGGEDTGFSEDGVVRTDFDFEEDAGADLALSPGRGAVVAGSSGSGLALARYELGPGPSDADADGVLDDGDQCPERFSERPSGCPKVERALELLVPASDRLAGRITSPTGACIAKQKVKVKRRVRRGPDRTVGHASTNARGEWRAHKRLGHGRFRAVAKRSIDPIAGRCNRARSRTVHA